MKKSGNAKETVQIWEKQNLQAVFLSLKCEQSEPSLLSCLDNSSKCQYYLYFYTKKKNKTQFSQNPTCMNTSSHTRASPIITALNQIFAKYHWLKHDFCFFYHVQQQKIQVSSFCVCKSWDYNEAESPKINPKFGLDPAAGSPSRFQFMNLTVKEAVKADDLYWV